MLLLAAHSLAGAQRVLLYQLMGLGVAPPTVSLDLPHQHQSRCSLSDTGQSDSGNPREFPSSYVTPGFVKLRLKPNEQLVMEMSLSRILKRTKNDFFVLVCSSALDGQVYCDGTPRRSICLRVTLHDGKTCRFSCSSACPHVKEAWSSPALGKHYCSASWNWWSERCYVLLKANSKTAQPGFLSPGYHLA